MIRGIVARIAFEGEAGCCNTKPGPKAACHYLSEVTGVKIGQKDWHYLRWMAEEELGRGLSSARASEQEVAECAERLADAFGGTDEQRAYFLRSFTREGSGNTKGTIDALNVLADMGELPDGVVSRPRRGEGRPLSVNDWATCRTIEDLQEMNVRFCESRHPDTLHPSHYGPLMHESDVIREDLIGLNRAGWLTLNSQPTVEREAPLYQRAYLTAFIPRDTAVRLLPHIEERFNYTIAHAGTGDILEQDWDGEVDTVSVHEGFHGTCTHWGQEDVDYAYPWVSKKLRSQIAANYLTVSISEKGTGTPRGLWDTLAEFIADDAQ